MCQGSRTVLTVQNVTDQNKSVFYYVAFFSILFMTKHMEICLKMYEHPLFIQLYRSQSA